MLLTALKWLKFLISFLLLSINSFTHPRYNNSQIFICNKAVLLSWSSLGINVPFNISTLLSWKTVPTSHTKNWTPSCPSQNNTSHGLSHSQIVIIHLTHFSDQKPHLCSFSQLTSDHIPWSYHQNLPIWKLLIASIATSLVWATITSHLDCCNCLLTGLLAFINAHYFILKIVASAIL